MRVAILGGGLAGCAAAYMLKKAGHEPVIYEAGDCLASGASGNQIGLYNPRFGAEWTPHSQYYGCAFERALHVFDRLDGIDFNSCGALHLITDDKKERRFSKMLESWGLGENHMHLVSAQYASQLAGIHIDHDALYLPQSGSVSPAKLCAVYAGVIESHFGSSVTHVDADITILAAGPALRMFEDSQFIDLRAVRGQVTLVKEAAPLKTNICYGGYVSTAVDGVHMVGSTFQRWLDHSELIEDDDADNLNKLAEAIPAFPQELGIVGHRASVRTTSKDHFPVVGQISDNVYVSTAHGSHGILSSLMAAEILANMIDNKPQALSDDVLAALSPYRFKD